MAWQLRRGQHTGTLLRTSSHLCACFDPECDCANYLPPELAISVSFEEGLVSFKVLPAAGDYLVPWYSACQWSHIADPIHLGGDYDLIVYCSIVRRPDDKKWSAGIHCSYLNGDTNPNYPPDTRFTSTFFSAFTEQADCDPSGTYEKFDNEFFLLATHIVSIP